MTKLSNIRFPLVAAALLTLLSSCAKEGCGDSTVQMQEMAFRATPEAVVTRGFVEGAVFEDSDGQPRDIRVTAHLHYGDNDENYIVDETFVLDDGVYRHDPPVLWPLDSSMDFLFYSSRIALENVEWGVYNAASRMKARVSDEHLQDDIMYAMLRGRRTLPVLDIALSHAQSWIRVHLSNPDGKDVVVQNVSLLDTFADGDLQISYDNLKAEGDDSERTEIRWDFRSCRARDITVPDKGLVYGTALTGEADLDILIPEQEKTLVRILFTLDGVSHSETYGMSKSTWLAGHRYEYEKIF